MLSFSRTANLRLVPVKTAAAQAVSHLLLDACGAGQPPNRPRWRAGVCAGPGLGGHVHGQGRLPPGAGAVWQLERAQGRDRGRAALLRAHLGAPALPRHRAPLQPG